MTKPEQVQPQSMEVVWHALHEFADESQEYWRINGLRRAAENILANNNDEEIRNRAIGALATMPDEEVMDEARSRNEAAEKQARATLELSDGVNVESLYKIVSFMHWSMISEDTVINLDWIGSPTLPNTFTALRELARLRGRAYIAEANMFGTTHVDIMADSDVDALLEQGYQQDIETLNFYKSDPTYDYSGVALKTVADIDAFYGREPSE